MPQQRGHVIPFLVNISAHISKKWLELNVVGILYLYLVSHTFKNIILSRIDISLHMFQYANNCSICIIMFNDSSRFLLNTNTLWLLGSKVWIKLNSRQKNKSNRTLTPMKYDTMINWEKVCQNRTENFVLLKLFAVYITRILINCHLILSVVNIFSCFDVSKRHIFFTYFSKTGVSENYFFIELPFFSSYTLKFVTVNLNSEQGFSLFFTIAIFLQYVVEIYYFNLFPWVWLGFNDVRGNSEPGLSNKTQLKLNNWNYWV